MGRTTNYTYDPRTGTWTQTTTNTSDPNTNGSGSNNDNPQQTTGGNGSNLGNTTSNPNTSTGATEKEYNEIEINTLEGDLKFITTNDTIKLKAGDTITLKGFGKHLSGKYYIKSVTRSISNNGYAHSAKVVRTDFGSSLIVSTTPTEPEKQEETPVPSPQPADTQTPQRTYTVKRGDCLWAIAKRYYGNGALWNKIYDANTNKIVNPNLIYPGQVLLIP